MLQVLEAKYGRMDGRQSKEYKNYSRGDFNARAEKKAGGIHEKEEREREQKGEEKPLTIGNRIEKVGFQQNLQKKKWIIFKGKTKGEYEKGEFIFIGRKNRIIDFIIKNKEIKDRVDKSWK